MDVLNSLRAATHGRHLALESLLAGHEPCDGRGYGVHLRLHGWAITGIDAYLGASPCPLHASALNLAEAGRLVTPELAALGDLPRPPCRLDCRGEADPPDAEVAVAGAAYVITGAGLGLAVLDRNSAGWLSRQSAYFGWVCRDAGSRWRQFRLDMAARAWSARDLQVLHDTARAVFDLYLELAPHAIAASGPLVSAQRESAS